MKRILPFLIVAPLLLAACNRTPAPATGAEDRAFWVESMVRIVTPVYENLSRGTLRQNMPVETVDGLNTGNKRKDVTHLEALGRSFDGIAPWLNLGPDDTPEGQARGKLIDLVLKSIAQAVNPDSPDYMPFDPRT